MKTTRTITIKRTIRIPQEKDGKIEMIPVVKRFPCKINAGVPFSHKMCENV